jgi:hypothetical protein
MMSVPFLMMVGSDTPSLSTRPRIVSMPWRRARSSISATWFESSRSRTVPAALSRDTSSSSARRGRRIS